MEQPGAGGGGATRQHAEEFELFVSSVGDYAIFLLDVDGHVLTWNLGAERLKGYGADEIVGQHFRRFYPAEDQDAGRPEQVLRVAAREGRHQEEGWRLRKDGSRFWANVLITAIRDPDGELLGFGKVTRDLTAPRLAEEQLRAAAADLRVANADLVQFRRLVGSVRDYAIFLLDPGGYVTTWNTGAEQIKGYAAEEIVGRHFSTFYTLEDQLRDHPAEELLVAAREGRFEEEGWRVRKDGTPFWAGVTISAVRDERGALVAFAKVTRDLTRRRAAEEELRRAHERLQRSNAELETFAAVAAHDLREPLTTVAGFVELLRDREGARLSDAGRGMVEHIAGSVGRMQALIENLLGYATAQEAPRPEAVGVHAAAERVVASLGALISQRGALIDLDVPQDAEVLAEASGVDVLLQNLISNGVKFGARGGPHVAVAATPEGDGWRVTVTDDGAGIALDAQTRIFAPFERLPDHHLLPGTGLGLAICSRIVERASGELGVDSAPGRGSTFWFVLPRAA